MKSGTRSLPFLMLLMLVFAAQTGHAHLVAITPESQLVTLDTIAQVSVRASHLKPIGLGSFDFDLLWDPSILSFSSADKSAPLGSSFFDIEAVAGRLTASAFSLEHSADLLALQSDDESLFSLKFKAIGKGTSAITFAKTTLGDVDGQIVAGTLTPGSITVVPSANTPEPMGLASAVIAALISAWSVKRRTLSVHRQQS